MKTNAVTIGVAVRCGSVWVKKTAVSTISMIAFGKVSSANRAVTTFIRLGVLSAI